MTPMPVDRTDSRPLHAQVADVLRAEIRDRSIPPGETLPSEAALRERFGVSRSVVRQALGTLIDEGTVHRARGRAPVAAAPTEHRRFVQRVTGMHDQFSSEGLDLSTTVLSLEQVRTASPAAGRHLGTYDLLRLERLRSVGGVPLSRVRTWLPAARVAGLTTEMLHDASLHRVLRQRFGLFPTNARHQVRAVAADPRMARDLDVPAQFPLLLLEGGTFDQGGAPLEWFESWHRSDRVVFDIEADDGGELVHPTPPPAVTPPAVAPPAEPGRAEGADLDRAQHLVEELRGELERLRGRH